MTLGKLSDICFMAGSFAEAEAFEKQAIALVKESPSVDKRRLSVMLHNLTMDYAHESKYAQADQSLKEMLAIDDSYLAPDDPGRLTGLGAAGALAFAEKKYPAARKIAERCIQIRQANKIEDDRATGVTLMTIAASYSHEGSYAKAESIYSRVIALLLKSEGEKGHSVAYALDGMATVYNHEGKLAKAEPLYRRAITAMEQSRGPEHPDLKTFMNDYAILLAKEHRDKEADAWRAKAKAIAAKNRQAK